MEGGDSKDLPLLLFAVSNPFRATGNFLIFNFFLSLIVFCFVDEGKGTLKSETSPRNKENAYENH